MLNSTEIMIMNYNNFATKPHTINLQAQASDILIIGKYLFAVIPSTNQISVFLLSNTTSLLLYNITTQTANNWNPKGNTDWTPNNIYLSSLNRIIVETNTGFYILGIDFKNFQINYFSFTTLNGKLSSIDYFRSIKIADDSILISEATKTASKYIQKLTEYNFINPYNITFIHEVVLPKDIQFYMPIISSSAVSSNLYYFLATNTTDGYPMIITYRLGSLVVNSIYQIMPFGNNNISPNNYSLNVASLLDSKEIVMVNDISLNKTFYWIVNLYPIMEIKTGNLGDPLHIQNQ